MLTIKKNYFHMLLPVLAFASLIFFLPIAFLYEKGGRVIFYYCAYFSILGLFVEVCKKKKLDLSNRKALAILILGIMFISWSLYVKYYLGEEGDFYFTAGKRCFLAFAIITYLFHIFRENYLSKSLMIKGSAFSLGLAFITASAFAFFQGFTSIDRIVLGINRATLTAYAYSILTLALITCVLKLQKSNYKWLFFLLVAIVSLYVIMLTQTRSAMVIHTLFLIYMAFNLFSATRNVKFISVVAILMLLAVGLSYKVIETRFESTVQEYRDYENGNDRTSLGSRFTMWKTGILAFEHAPFGQSQVERNNFITAYLTAHNQKDSWAIFYINVHLHNEFIQYASLFGVVGILVLLYLFYTFIIAELRAKRSLTPLAAVGVATLLYGMADVVLTSVEFIAIFSVLAVLLLLIEAKDEN